MIAPDPDALRREKIREEVARIVWSFRRFYVTLDEAKRDGRFEEEIAACYLHTERILEAVTRHLMQPREDTL